MNKIKIGIIGASGYVGAELIRLLLGHPHVEIVAISSVSYEGQEIQTLYPGFRYVYEMALVDEDTVIEMSDIIFTAVPHGFSQKLAKKCLDKRKKCIDLGADFRLKSEADYTAWYDGVFEDENLHQQAVYGMPELFRADIRKAKLVANPGCYPTASTLALAPVLDIIDSQHIIIDAKSGVTGAGKGLTDATHFPSCNESFAPYKIAAHRHLPEIEQTLTNACKKPVQITFVPHLLPVNRGILTTIYATLTTDETVAELKKRYDAFYQEEYFVRVLNDDEIANINTVRLSNYCDISIHLDQRNKQLIIISAIDNMVKGAAGQAIQNMNIMCGLSEIAGLTAVSPAF